MAHIDADWAGDLADRKSISGVVFMIGNSAVFWKTAKQDCIILSSTKSEHMAMCTAVKSILWIQVLSQELGVSMNRPTTLYEDNQGAMVWATEGVRNAKHVAIRPNFVHEAVQNGSFSIHFCRSEHMLADIFTKVLQRVNFEKNRTILGVLKM